ncbi:hypothetical protein [Mucilaginibacter sp. 10I4]|uniref:hypothetical protein n=1 Tax=Mucilaginibacter sp. 10I4 TaxID=3048580 RepID=UPI002B22A751|nr:hypothetical protein [Mucilaginibacter sp. 10I4]MEB0249600.1 hypothetical protein [Mucilaginibacter sp. 5B2]MEB0262290.1 hypothetical protein [Mucilaginibacter sp. 10I4]
MTFRIANNQIHIGWGQTITVLVTIVTAVWAIRAGYDDYVQGAQKTNAKLDAIQKELSIKSSTDSIQTYNIAQLSRFKDSIHFSRPMEVSKASRTASMHYYTERYVNGHLILTEVKPN